MDEELCKNRHLQFTLRISSWMIIEGANISKPYECDNLRIKCSKRAFLLSLHVFYFLISLNTFIIVSFTHIFVSMICTRPASRVVEVLQKLSFVL